MATTPKSRHGVDLPMAIHKMSSREALPLIAEASKGRVLVSFSGGKDAVGCVLALREFFPDMQLYHMYTVPGLRITEEGLTYYERLWGQRIIRVMNPNITGTLAEFAFQPYHRRALIDRFELEPATHDDIAREVRRDLGWDKTVPVAVGIRMDDSIFRKSSLEKSGPYQRKRHLVYPVFDWTRQQLRDELIRTGTRLAPDYAIMKRSFSGDGIDYRFIKPLRDHYPDDFAKLLAWYPLLEAEIYRYEFIERRAKAAMRRPSGFTL